FRRAVDRHVHARILERGSQNRVLDVVERELASGDRPTRLRPHAVDLPDAVARTEREETSADRVVIDDRAEREDVVRVDPEGEARGARRPRLLGGRDGCEIRHDAIERCAVGRELAVVDARTAHDTRQQIAIGREAVIESGLQREDRERERHGRHPPTVILQALTSPFRIDPSDHAGLATYLIDRGIIGANETPITVSRAGAGNMNLTLRVVTPERRIVVKQGRPWVEKYPEIPAPADRTLVEAAFYRTIAAHAPVASRMPALLHVDGAARIIALEDIDGADFTDLYRPPTIG